MKIHQNHIKIIFFIPIRAPTRRPRWVRDPCTLHEREKGSLKLFRVFSHPSRYTHHGNKKPYPFYRSFFSRNDAGNYVVILLLSGRGIRMSRGVREQTDAPQVSKRYSYRGGALRTNITEHFRHNFLMEMLIYNGYGFLLPCWDVRINSPPWAPHPFPPYNGGRRPPMGPFPPYNGGRRPDGRSGAESDDLDCAPLRPPRGRTERSKWRRSPA